MNPGITRTVEFLRGHGFDTCDSGDGVTHDHPCDRPYPYVAMRCEPSKLVVEADRLRDVLVVAAGVAVVSSTAAWSHDSDAPVGVCIGADYDPVDRVGVIDLSGLDDTGLIAVRGA